MRRLTTARRGFRRGLTLSELLVAVTILLVIMVGIAGLLESSWQSFSDLKWQNRVDSEARQALDAMSDSIRLAGNDVDAIGGDAFISSTIDTDSSSNFIGMQKTDGSNDEFYTVKPGRTSSSTTNYLARLVYSGGQQAAAFYIRASPDPTQDGLHFDYEYRVPSAIGTPQWTFKTLPTSDLGATSNIYYTVRTIYITVTAEYNPYPNSIDGRLYTRTLTGAVTLRNPCNLPIPPSM